MFYALTWFVVVALLALWALAAWALHAVAVWSVLNAGALSGAAPGIGGIGLPDWLEPLVPPEVAQWVSQILAGLAPMVENMLQAAPALADGLTTATWVIWGLGSVLLVLLGIGLHLLFALWCRHSGNGSGPHAGSSLSTG